MFGIFYFDKQANMWKRYNRTAYPTREQAEIDARGYQPYSIYALVVMELV